MCLLMPHDSTSQPGQRETQLCRMESVLSLDSHDAVMLAESLGRTAVCYSDPQLTSPAYIIFVHYEVESIVKNI